MRHRDSPAVVSDDKDVGRRRSAGPGEAARPWPAPDGGREPGEWRLLATMPPHAITATRGEAGLRERLALEIASFPDDDRQRIECALDLAARLHAADRRQSEPYLNHLLRVAIRIISHYRITDPDVICAALLHDTAEDHPAQLAPGGSQAEAIAALAAQFGTRTAGLVAAVTNPMDNGPGGSHAQYHEHVAASLATSPWARVIKMSDFTDNGVGIIHTTGPRIGKLANKYAPLVPVLRELIARPDTPLDDDVKAHIFDQLDRAGQRFAAIRPMPESDAATI
jgi:HD domain